MDTAKLVLEFLARIAPAIFDYIKGELDGGADAEKFRKEDVKLYIAFGGDEGGAVEVQRLAEADMLDPDAE